MELTDIFSLLGGLALFLYGMQMMSNGLEAAAGNRMKKILEKLTSNRFLGVLVGAGITAVIQSSSATTVMVVGFVNSGMMTLQQAVWIIMGANIGTTITGQLIALDIGVLAPLIAFIGVACIVFVKKEKVQYYGMIVAGLGVLFIGMDMMSAAMMPLRDSEMFVNMVASTRDLVWHSGRCRFHCNHSVVIGIGGDPAGFSDEWDRRFESCGLCTVWSEYRNVYHGCFGGHRDKPQCQAHDHHSFKLQHYWYDCLYACLYDNAADDTGGFLDTNECVWPDCKYAYALQYRDDIAAVTFWYEARCIGTAYPART